MTEAVKNTLENLKKNNMEASFLQQQKRSPGACKKAD